MIKAYLFSDITRQIDHTYYSLHGSTTGPSKFFYNLKDYKVSMLSLLEPFIYEVEIYPESVVGCFDDYIEARKYKIIRNVKFVEYLKETNLSDEIAEEFNAILNGNDLDLSIVELKDEYQLEYIKLLEYYKRQYSISEFSTFEKTSSKCEQQKLKGTRKFEIIFNRDPSELVYNVWLNDYIMSRQLTQSQFNQLCKQKR